MCLYFFQICRTTLPLSNYCKLDFFQDIVIIKALRMTLKDYIMCACHLVYYEKKKTTKYKKILFMLQLNDFVCVFRMCSFFIHS